jgi:hypothetical protein
LVYERRTSISTVVILAKAFLSAALNVCFFSFQEGNTKNKVKWETKGADFG